MYDESNPYIWTKFQLLGKKDFILFFYKWKEGFYSKGESCRSVIFSRGDKVVSFFF